MEDVREKYQPLSEEDYRAVMQKIVGDDVNLDKLNLGAAKAKGVPHLQTSAISKSARDDIFAP